MFFNPIFQNNWIKSISLLQLTMSGDADNNVNEIIQNILNGTTDSELSSLEHVDAPSEGMWILCGIFIAMVTVALIIILLAYAISKLRKHEDNLIVSNNNNSNINHNTTVVTQENELRCVTISIPENTTTPATITLSDPEIDPDLPPFFWKCSTNLAQYKSSQLSIATNNDQAVLVTSEEVTGCKGFRQNLRGKWTRLVKKKPEQELYILTDEMKEQLKYIYVY